MRSEWLDHAWWADRLACVQIDDPALCNHRITLAHYELSLALHDVLGPDTGANFHTWAVWGSLKAGTTIRREDVAGVRPLAAALGALGGGLGTALAQPGPGGRGPRLAAAVLGGAALNVLVGRALRDAARHILTGNRIVLEDIGRVTADFVLAFGARPEREPDRFDRFVSALRPGATSVGGQELLGRAFRHYYEARHEPDANRRHEHMLLGNLLAILHEHVRLQPQIQAAMPLLLRPWTTTRLLDFRIGTAELSVARDVVPWEDPRAPTTLHRLESRDLIAFLDGEMGWDRTPNSVAGSAADDWSDLRDRMNYIVDLFRFRHFDVGLFSSPYTDEQREKLLGGRLP